MWLKTLPILISIFISVISPASSPEIVPPPLPNVSLDQIFSSDHSWISTISAQHRITIKAVGDIMPGRTISAYHSGDDFSFLYSGIQSFFHNADLTAANLESPVTSDCRPFTDGMRFCIRPYHLLSIKSAGFSVLSLANNHIYDYGEPGFNSTLQTVASVGITALPPNVTETVLAKNTKIAMIGFNFIPGMKSITPKDTQVFSVISSATKSSDLVIVLPHWGTEYTFQPDNNQVRLAHLMVDSGADLVLGSHPHWIQPVEIYHGKLIVYSHGNFVFDQYWSEKTRKGIIGTYTYLDHQLINASFDPVYIAADGHPQFINGSDRQSILDQMKSASRQE